MTYKANWATGDILLAADQNALAKQAISRFADATARDAAITSPSEGQACWLSDTNEFQIYSGAAWVPLLDTDTISVSSGNYTISTDLTVSGNVTIQSLDMDTIVEGDVIYGSGADTLSRLVKGSDDEVLTLASGIPSWAATSGMSWSGSTANGIGTYGSSSSIVAESTATYDGTTLQLTTSGGGLKLDGLSSSNANTLDDYEEGTFTVTVACGSGSVTMTGGEDTCAYVKIGRAVHIQGWISLSAISSPADALTITGLPFTAAALAETADHARIGIWFGTPATDTAGEPYSYVYPGETQLRVNSGSGQAVDTTIANHLSASSAFIIGGTYYANA